MINWKVKTTDFLQIFENVYRAILLGSLRWAAMHNTASFSFYVSFGYISYIKESTIFTAEN